MPGFDARRGGETPLLPTGNSEGRSAVRRRVLGLVMFMMLVDTSAGLACAGIEILKMSRNTHVLPLPDNAQLTPVSYGE